MVILHKSDIVWHVGCFRVCLEKYHTVSANPPPSQTFSQAYGLEWNVFPIYRWPSWIFPCKPLKTSLSAGFPGQVWWQRTSKAEQTQTDSKKHRPWASLPDSWWHPRVRPQDGFLPHGPGKSKGCENHLDRCIKKENMGFCVIQYNWKLREKYDMGCSTGFKPQADIMFLYLLWIYPMAMKSTFFW